MNFQKLKQISEELHRLLRFWEIDEKLFEAEYTPEADGQFCSLVPKYQNRVTNAIKLFEKIGVKYKNINNLGDGLFELKPKDVRIYFMYHPNKRKIIIIGLVVLKKTQKAPDKYKEQARKNIADYLKKEGI